MSYKPPLSPPPSEYAAISMSAPPPGGVRRPGPPGESSWCGQLRHSASFKRYKYLRRIFRFRQMDFEFAVWQMLYLLVSPQKVYRNFQYRKQTKDQWARDDPAFLVLLSFCLVASSVGFSLCLGLGFVGFIKFILWVVFVDCIGVGLIIASLFWFVTNHYLLKATHAGQKVEWAYAFDVHLNAFFPLLIVLHVVQLAFLNAVIVKPWFIGILLGNTLWLIAISYYIYITFLGYSCLPSLKNTQVLLYPITPLFLIYFITLITGPNFSKGLATFYTFRVLS